MPSGLQAVRVFQYLSEHKAKHFVDRRWSASVLVSTYAAHGIVYVLCGIILCGGSCRVFQYLHRFVDVEDRMLHTFRCLWVRTCYEVSVLAGSMGPLRDIPSARERRHQVVSLSEHFSVCEYPRHIMLWTADGVFQYL